MSHIETGTCKILNLEALKAAVKEMGAEFVEGQRTYKWYGRSVGDAPLPAGMRKEDLGKCTHAIKVPGVNYEVGVVKQKDGSYTLAWDSWKDPDRNHDGHKLIEKFGKGMEELSMLYSVHVATMQAWANGWTVQRQKTKSGEYDLVFAGMR